MKSVLLRVLAVILALISLSLICYPFVSNYLMSLNQDSTIESYRKTVDNSDKKVLQEALNDAVKYNKSLYGKVVLTDPFDPTYCAVEDKEYESLLNLSGNSVMGSIEIPCIDLNLPIYHGTTDEVLKKGAGHLRQTSLPVGGIGSHTVLTGHTGLSSASLFTDINLLKKGDLIFIHCLNENLAYEVDKIKVVLPNQTDDLKINPKKDLITLVTCTPYGINSHRLLVRGKRTDYQAAKSTVINSRASESTWMMEYKRAITIGFAVLLLILFIFFTYRLIRKLHRKKVIKKLQ